MRPAFRNLLIALCAVGGAGYLWTLPDSHSTITAAAAKPKPPAEELDYSRPVYTRAAAFVCPLSAAADRRVGRGLEAANEAAAMFFGRSEALTKAGCSEWKEGIRVYISEGQHDYTWQLFAESPDAMPNAVILKWHTSNNPASSSAAKPQ